MAAPHHCALFFAAALGALVTASAGNDEAYGSSGEWPGCQEPDTVVQNGGQAVFTNLQGLGAVTGCFLDDCQHTDKFVASSLESCTKICLSLPACQFWVWGQEDNQTKCWFRSGDGGREAGAPDWVSGPRSCHPAGQKPLVMGNGNCWVEGFNYETCCHPNFGAAGNSQCWDDVFSYDRCCLPDNYL
mmetsp:Transcript_76958/g.174019  ORF Transcript_76958/g.174019 Transcript_76958/m.174019 type:complete len:187 (-) Transcript_76958:119-679(-)